jgi:hypothetical protein
VAPVTKIIAVLLIGQASPDGKDILVQPSRLANRLAPQPPRGFLPGAWLTLSIIWPTRSMEMMDMQAISTASPTGEHTMSLFLAWLCGVVLVGILAAMRRS